MTSALQNGDNKKSLVLERVPAGRWALPDDLAGLVIHLCSRSGDNIGEEIHSVDGGYLDR
jgi:2-deoxy-D-gluconate 3-dehydrogenase